jgi:alpha-tubulin suppressor-like RCC1 family protein
MNPGNMDTWGRRRKGRLGRKMKRNGQRETI